MKRVITTEGGCRIERYINKDKVASKRWGKVWFKWDWNDGLMEGCACASMLDSYLPSGTMKEVRNTWRSDFITRVK